MTSDEGFADIDDTEFDDENFDDDSTEFSEALESVAAVETNDSADNDADQSSGDGEFVIVDNQITDYLDVDSTEAVPALFALPQTGVARVDDAIARLGDLENLPVNEHVEIFEDVQRRLHETLADLASS